MDGSHTLAQLNLLPQLDAERELRSCCASTVWARELAVARPFADRDELLAAADAALSRLDWSSVEEALAAHPRIGQRAQGETREAAWSRREQSGALSTGTAADAGTAAALREANQRYEERFGHVFLICATGRTAAEMLDAAHQRLTNDEATERAVVRVELGRITRLRLERLLDA